MLLEDTPTQPLKWVIFHLLLGVACTLTAWPLIAWFYVVLLSQMQGILKGKTVAILSAIVYLASFELIARMARTSPYIPYELSKYLLFVLLAWGIVCGHAKGKGGWMLLLLLLPAFFFDKSNAVRTSDLIFNLMGPVNVALAVIFFYRLEVSEQIFSRLIHLALYPLMAVLAFSIFKAPDLSEMEFSLGANFRVSGGFGPNQVSTAFGLGALLVFIGILLKKYITGKRWMDIALLVMFIFRGLLTFSRGGMIGGFLAIIVIVFFIQTAGSALKRRYHLPRFGKFVLPLLTLGYITFSVADNITRGLLSLRYQGETRGTLADSKEKNLNTITSNRADIAWGDIILWGESPVFGVGAGASKYLRPKVNGMVPHVEFSRLLAEHGIFGLFYIVILLFTGYRVYKLNVNPLMRGILMALWILAIYTTFHNAMRTYVTPLLLGLSLLWVQQNLSESPEEQLS